MRGSGRRAPLRDVASAGVRSTAGEAAAPGLEATGLRKGPHESALAPARPASSRGQLPCGEGGARGRAPGRRAATGSVVPSAGGRGRELVDGRTLPSWSSAQLACSRSGSAERFPRKNSSLGSCSRRWGPCPSPTPCLVCPFYLFIYLADRLDTGASWRVLALSQAHHWSRLSDSVKNGNALGSVHNAAVPAR